MSIKESLVKVKKHPRNYKHYNKKFKEDGNYYIVPVFFFEFRIKNKSYENM